MLYLTNRFQVAVRLFSNRSQMTSKCDKNKKVAHEAQPVKMFLRLALLISTMSDHIRSDTIMICMNFNSYASLVIFFIISVLFCSVFEH